MLAGSCGQLGGTGRQGGRCVQPACAGHCLSGQTSLPDQMQPCVEHMASTAALEVAWPGARRQQPAAALACSQVGPTSRRSASSSACIAWSARQSSCMPHRAAQGPGLVASGLPAPAPFCLPPTFSQLPTHNTRHPPNHTKPDTRPPPSCSRTSLKKRTNWSRIAPRSLPNSRYLPLPPAGEGRK